jgi:glycosyltransferase XagB
MDTIVTQRLAPLHTAAIKPPLGQWLLHERVITSETLVHALEKQRVSGGRLGDILTHSGALSTLTLYRILAKHHLLPFFNTLETPPDALLFDVAQIADYLRLEAVPCCRDADELVVATTDPERFHRERGSAFSHARIRLVITSPLDIAWTIQRVFGKNFSHHASESLRYHSPHYALSPNKTSTIKTTFICLLLLMLCWAYPFYSMTITLTGACIFFISTLLFKTLLVMVGVKARDAVFAVSNICLTPDNDCPPYTVLVPLFQEAHSVPDLLACLGALDYPAHQLDIKLIVEAEDDATIAAIKVCNPDRRFHLIIVPPSHPKTKPKACNYALKFARGEFVTIYDAEDAPDPTQLRHAVALFRAYPEVACLQACLSYYNHDDNLLTRLFSLEYQMLFEFMLPALYRLHIPIPLGGTSNHLRRNVLEDLHAWDAYNVTEDADLGIRLACEGYITLPFASHTQEEAPAQVHAWIKQRSRWIKGYIQTWGVLARMPMKRHAQLGGRGFWGVHFFIGAASLAYILAPILWLVALGWMLFPSVHPPISPTITMLCIATFGAGVAAQWGCAIAVMQGVKRHHLWTILCYPCYFCLHSIASVRSLWQLLFAPSHWDKTTHGMTKVRRVKGDVNDHHRTKNSQR